MRIILGWLGFLALWLVFVYQTTTSELAVGSAASALAVISSYVAFRVVQPCFHPRLRWILPVWRLPAMIAKDLWLLFKHLMREIVRRPSRSSFETAHFSTYSDKCRAGAQRGLAVLFVSTTPNSVVIDIDTRNAQLFFHQVEPSPAPKLLRELQE